MQIFLSYASEEKAIAEPIAFSLRARGYKVFLDRDDLPAGGEYDQKIEQAVAQSGLFIFLISPASVAKGRFTLSELEFARRRWLKPDGHVLPVMVRPTPLGDVPSFLKSVTILEPTGNIAAEVASAVEPMVSGRDKRTLYVLGGLGALSGLLTEPAQQFFRATVGGAEIHRAITVDLVLSGVVFGVALLAGLALLMRFRPRMVLIPFVVIGAYFLAMETWVALAPIFDKGAGQQLETSALRPKCEAIAADTSGAAVDPVLKQACDALRAADAQGSTLSQLTSLPGAAATYGLAGVVGALLTLLGTGIAVGRRATASGSLLVSLVGGGVAAIVGVVLVVTSAAPGAVLFVPWQALVGATVGRLVR